MFEKGTKRDATLFNSFKENKHLDSWKRDIVVTARAQDIEKFLTNCIPITNEDKELFKEKQKFMCSIFDRILLTNKGKAFVQQHEDDFDEQSVYSKLVIYHTQSVKASLDKSNLLSYITSVCIESLL